MLKYENPHMTCGWDPTIDAHLPASTNYDASLHPTHPLLSKFCDLRYLNSVFPRYVIFDFLFFWEKKGKPKSPSRFIKIFLMNKARRKQISRPKQHTHTQAERETPTQKRKKKSKHSHQQQSNKRSIQQRATSTNINHRFRQNQQPEPRTSNAYRWSESETCSPPNRPLKNNQNLCPTNLTLFRIKDHMSLLNSVMFKFPSWNCSNNLEMSGLITSQKWQ